MSYSDIRSGWELWNWISGRSRTKNMSTTGIWKKNPNLQLPLCELKTGKCFEDASRINVTQCELSKNPRVC